MQYTKVETPSRIKERPSSEIDTFFGKFVELPNLLSSSQESWIVVGKKRVRTYIINPSLAAMLNAETLKSTAALSQLRLALTSFDNQVSQFIRENLLQTKMKSGYMSFAQISSSVAEDEVFIDLPTYRKLCNVDSKWKTSDFAIIQRYPNLGPKTTSKLKLVVGEAPRFGSLLKEFLKINPELDLTDATEMISEYGPIILNPKTLKDNFEGDCDGDLLYMIPSGHASPTIKNIETDWTPKTDLDSEIELMFKKSSRLKRSQPIKEVFPTLIDRTPIGEATHAIRFTVFSKACKSYSGEKVPMHKAWLETAPWAINLVEFVMDIRKGDFTAKQVDAKISEINKICRAYGRLKARGNWFCCIALSSEPLDISAFSRSFTNLSEAKEYLRGVK